jgi:hypothetical protein
MTSPRSVGRPEGLGSAAVQMTANSARAASKALPAWALDLAAAGLASLAINGLGAALLAFGAHGRSREPESTVVAAVTNDATAAVPHPKLRMIAAPPEGLGHFAKFAVEMMRPDSDGATPARDIRAAYLRWCRDRDHDALPSRDMADLLAALCTKANLEIVHNEGDPLIRGVKLLASA